MHDEREPWQDQTVLQLMHHIHICIAYQLFYYCFFFVATMMRWDMHRWRETLAGLILTLRRIRARHITSYSTLTIASSTFGTLDKKQPMMNLQTAEVFKKTVRALVNHVDDCIIQTLVVHSEFGSQSIDIVVKRSGKIQLFRLTLFCFAMEWNGVHVHCMG